MLICSMISRRFATSQSVGLKITTPSVRMRRCRAYHPASLQSDMPDLSTYVWYYFGEVDRDTGLLAERCHHITIVEHDGRQILSRSRQNQSAIAVEIDGEVSAAEKGVIERYERCRLR